MAIKNIEMSVYNGSSYDTLLPVTSDENVTIASAISGLFGLGADSTLTDILQKLSNAVIWDGSSTELPNGSSIVTGARIETGSYVGTGTYGANNPCSLTFEFEPIITKIYGASAKTSNPSGVAIHALNNLIINTDVSHSFLIEYFETNYEIKSDYIIFLFPGNSVQWHGSDAYRQLNSTSWIYYYFALG